jgi:CHASE1-domain containing sensor protein
MEITFVWSWLSFWIGVASTVVGLFLTMLLVAFRQFAKQRSAKKSAEKLFGSGLDDFLKS